VSASSGGVILVAGKGMWAYWLIGMMTRYVSWGAIRITR